MSSQGAWAKKSRKGDTNRRKHVRTLKQFWKSHIFPILKRYTSRIFQSLRQRESSAAPGSQQLELGLPAAPATLIVMAPTPKRAWWGWRPDRPAQSVGEWWGWGVIHVRGLVNLRWWSTKLEWADVLGPIKWPRRWVEKHSCGKSKKFVTQLSKYNYLTSSCPVCLIFH